MTLASSLLRVENLSIAFRSGPETTNTVVQDVSFTLEPGQTVALVGESGSGKSVSALSILKLLPASTLYPSGQILFEGHDVLTMSEPELRQMRGGRIGIVFQEPMTSLNPLHNIEQQIGETLALHKGLRGDKARAEIISLLQQVGFADAKDRLDAYPHELSGGQRQRVMIAMALAGDPELLIADEPTTALDVSIQAQILHLLKKLQKERGLALLLITHDLGIVRKFADHVVVMHKGKVVEQGTAETVFTSPQQDYTRTLINAEPKGHAKPLASDAAPVLTCQKLRVYFPIKSGWLQRTTGYIKAVQDISLTLKRGETLGIVGESGSGKTTLGQAILRLIKSEGSIRFGETELQGQNGSALRSLRSKIQIIFQDPYGSLSPRLSMGEIVAEGLSIHQPQLSEAEKQARIDETLRDVGLDPSLQHRYPHEFSGGQRQRIAIARALILQPELIVLDEPTSALDLTTQSQIVDLLRDLQAKYGLSYLFISHDLRVVKALAHQVMVMRKGEVVEQASTEMLFNAPQHPYTKALMKAAFELEAEELQA
jgi:microcin C transport system ATP-binding protein